MTGFRPADHFRKRLVQAGGRARVSGGGRTRVSDAPRFQHPHQGMGVFCSKLAEGLERRGGSVYLSTRVERLLVAEGRVEGLQIRGAPQEYDWVVSSMPFTCPGPGAPGCAGGDKRIGPVVEVKEHNSGVLAGRSAARVSIQLAVCIRPDVQGRANHKFRNVAPGRGGGRL